MDLAPANAGQEIAPVIRNSIQSSTARESHATARPVNWIGGGKSCSDMSLEIVDRASPVRACTCCRRNSARAFLAVFKASIWVIVSPWAMV